MTRKTTLVVFLVSTCNYKKGQKKRVCPRVAKIWERKRIVKIIK